ncbi:hypothetical protein SAY86_001726 [Trapa natans]|nr:hypothetical protein SAY86_001726 [Trapa natans]
MIDQAREELQNLEALHPRRFEPLKLQLKSFISLLESSSHDRFYHTHDSGSLPPSSTATTQASTCRKRKRKRDGEMGDEGSEVSCGAAMRKKMRPDRVDAALERARLCLEKIRELKSSF